ncbi:CGNR zinc finger domain-containing protein [Jiangella asiatica]|uniref:Zinc finger CGNR domain-containing protein n=1 Tax=Jiangella asiatica TaxID=2530372 RepID=A0A4R5CTC4_9ACTN|nr:ABATE domain-containing protein [Jiangella asiatica]TDE01055.1 hypothetical protein E1269_24040 [Jiangella asiatica]
MAEPVDLDSGSYGGTYKLIGGARALDFANLVSYRGTARQHDWLEPVDNLAVWAAAAGLEADLGAGPAEPRELRELLARVFLAVADGDVPAGADVDHIGTLAAGAWAGRRLTFDDDAGVARWSAPEPDLAGELALDAAVLLTSERSLRRVRACSDCRWVFLDSTRNRSRRWCDPADCGNRVRQRRHYRREKSRGRPGLGGLA